MKGIILRLACLVAVLAAAAGAPPEPTPHGVHAGAMPDVAHASARRAPGGCSGSYTDIDPCADTAKDLVGSTGLTFRVRVTNNGDADDTYDISCSVTAPVTSCAVDPTVTIAAGGWAFVYVTYAVGTTVGDGDVHVELTSESSFDDVWADRTSRVRGPYTVFVTPDTIHRNAQASRVSTQLFTVQNQGFNTTAYTLSTACTGTVTGCTPSTGSVTLAPEASVNVALTHSVGSVGSTGLARLLATASSDATVKDTGTVSVTSVAGGPPQLAADSTVNPALTLDRDLCTSIKVAENAASECGDLRVIHALPTLRTLNKVRQPMLFYGSQAAHPAPVVDADLTISASAGVPDSVRAALEIGSVLVDSGSWVGSNWTAGSTRRIALSFDALGFATGAYTDTLITASWYSGVADTSRTPGRLFIVNRSASPFGAGWWLAGLDQLLLDSLATSRALFWIGGDGSHLRYQQVAGQSTVWVAPSLDHPDTLKKVGAYYIQYLPHGLQVQFDTLTGRHVNTVNRLGHVTSFGYDGAGRLTTITVPPTSANASYVFHYNASGKLDSVYAKSGSAQRAVAVVDTTGSRGRLDAIQDPDSQRVRFAYDATVTNRMTSRTDKRGTVASFTYDAGRKLRETVIANGLVWLWTYAAQTKGLHGSDAPAALPVDSAYFQLIGPRASQVTDFWLDRFGQPTRIRDALGDTTSIQRTDVRWPAGVTRVAYANGRVMKAVVDAAGLDSLVIDSAGRTAQFAEDTTLYLWDLKWRFLAKSRSPMGVTDTIAYSAINGNRLWQQDGRGDSSRVTFGYDRMGLLDTTRTTISPPYTLAYDTAGSWNLRSVTTPLGYVTLHFSDAFGRDTLVSEPIDTVDRDTTRYVYDAMDHTTMEERIGPALAFHSIYVNTADGRDRQVLTIATHYDAAGTPDSVSRSASPDTNAIGTQTTRFRYDALGRKTAEIAPDGKIDSLYYDAAGNIVSQRTRRGYVITMSYDLLNRLTVRSSPTVTYARDTLYGKVFPGYSTGGLTIAGTTDQFTYDAMGNLTEALNDAADVRRTYGLDGSVRTDTLIISNYGASSPSGSGHRYGLVFRYDRDGRRVWMQYPHNLTWPYSNSYYALHDTAWFDYDSAWGALTAAHDIMGNGFTFSYDAEGRTIGIAEPGGVVERYAYDDDGRLHTSTQTSPFNNANDSGFAGGYIHADTLYYDGRGKLLRSAGHLGEAHEQFYTGLGALAVLRNVTVVTGAGPEIGNSETWQDDALGNNVSWAGFAKDVPPETDYYYQSGTGRLVRSLASGASAQDTTIYDAAGSTLKQYRVNWYTQCSTDPSPCGGQTSQAQVPYQQWVHNYYDGSDRLTVADSRSSIPAIDGYAGGYEEYRYDALGRRVLHRFRSCGNCSSYIDRTVYDGDQYLLEIRREGSDTSQAATLENDSLPDVLAAPYGRVAYLNARGFDKPLDIVRMEYDGDDPLFALVPHENWRGLFDAGTFADGAGRMTGVTVNWQSQNASANYLTTRPYTADWHGSIIQDKREGSGALYMRNRYFDPATGRFTQEDPIGLAGGINLYGFAKGDPVNFSDPFGLCPPADNNTADCSDEVKRLMAIDKPLESPAFDPVAFATGFVGGLFKGAGARAVAAEADEAAAGVRAATRGLEKQLEKHIQKLEQYKANPFAFDNKGLLRNAPSDEIRQKIIAGRIRKLEGQIETFRKAIQKAIDEATKR